MSVLLCFVPIVSGEVVVGKTVAVALQEPMLVSTTVRENLRMGNPHADDEQLRLALKTACLGEYVDRLDDRIGTGGSQLSGGQASRLAVARMLLAAPEADLVLLDEPTAHLDAETATQLVANVLEFLTGKTVIMVTHDPAEAARADQVISIQ
jgi:ABC-type transport system involved in cytochrome bd biosynthesis fused ATPase/permease subunit